MASKFETVMGRTLVEVTLTFAGYPFVVEEANPGATESQIAGEVGRQLAADAKKDNPATYIQDLLDMSVDVSIDKVEIPRSGLAIRTRIIKERD
jgi:hypothetical protein